MPLINHDKTREILLGMNFLNCGEPYPGTLRVYNSVFKNECVVYTPIEYCHIDIVMDDEHLVGHSECSCCHRNIDIFVKFCPYCGAKVKGKHIKEAPFEQSDSETADNYIQVEEVTDENK